MVTEFEEFDRFKNFIQARWKEIIHPAIRLEIVTTCKYYCENGQIYLDKATFLAPEETFFALTNLEPGSKCEFTLKAVINPASVDNGISVTYMVLPASKSSLYAHVNYCTDICIYFPVMDILINCSFIYFPVINIVVCTNLHVQHIGLFQVTMF